MNNDNTDLQTLLDESNQRHQSYREQVRARIIQAHHDGDICLAGMNGGLRDLGLKEYVQGWRGKVTIDVFVKDTDDECIARKWAEHAVSLSSSDSDVSFDLHTIDAHDFEAGDGEGE